MKTIPKPFILASAIFLIAFSAILSGCGSKIEPGVFSPEKKASVTPTKTTVASVFKANQWVEAVGTVRPKTETRIEARVTGQVLDVKINPGNEVAKGDLLVTIDSRQLNSRREQARQALKTATAGREQAKHALEAAQAGFKQAKANYTRVKGYVENQAATAQELESAESTFRQAEAGVKRAREALAAADAGILQAKAVVKESTIALEYTRIVAPEAGIILKRFVEPGDLALPGKPLVAIRTSGALRLEAHVREGLITRVKPGSTLKVAIETLHKEMDAVVEEIVPYADPNSRTFLVKATIPPVEGLYPGMFGKLRIPVDQRRIITLPRAAIRQVGQLELVWVKSGEEWVSRYVKTGQRRGNAVEILSGLDGMETIGWEVKKHG